MPPSLSIVIPSYNRPELLRACLASDPTNASLYLQLAALYRRAGQLEEARAVLQEGLATPEHAAFVARLAQRRGRPA